MEKIDVRVESFDLIPIRAHNTDAGLDLKAKDYAMIRKGERVLVGTGVRVRIPEGYVGLLVARSSLSKRNLMLANSVGVIDSEYRGELLVALINTGENIIEEVQAGDKIAQLLIVPVALPVANVVIETLETWENTKRGVGGFGSTGK